mgnify:CR=1 FL=1
MDGLSQTLARSQPAPRGDTPSSWTELDRLGLNWGGLSFRQMSVPARRIRLHVFGFYIGTRGVVLAYDASMPKSPLALPHRVSYVC